MAADHFEPFGESVDIKAPSADPADGSRILYRAGTAAFWTLVIAIVTARVLVLDPDLEKIFSAAISFLS